MVRTRSVYLWIASLLIVGALIYAILVVGDHITASYLKRMYDGFKYSDVEAIIAERREKEDLPQRARAIAEGYHSVMMPAQIEASEPLKALAEQLGAAPLAPHPKTPLYLCNEGYGLVKYTSDRFGFRNPDSAWDTQVDVVLIGDSFVQGECVAEEDTMSGILRDRLNVLSLGTASNHPVHYAALLKIIIPVIKPGWAVLVFYSNDLSEGTKGSLYYDLYFNQQPVYFDRPNGKLQLSKPISAFYERTFSFFKGRSRNDRKEVEAKKRKAALEHFKLLNLIILAKQVYAASPFGKHLPFSSQLAIDTLRETCKRYTCEPIVVYLPNSPYWRPDPRGANYARALCAYASERKIRCRDLSSALAPLGRDAYAKKGPHFSPTGYKVVADQIEQLLKN
jgi:hypothetical protein